MMKFKKYFLIVFFISFIYLPLIGTIFDTQNGLYNPKLGTTKNFPEFKNNIGKFCDEFLEYYEDNFGFRYNFMKFASNLKIKLFKTYPQNVDIKVLKGKDGWLFYKLGNELEDFQGRVPLSNNTLNKLITKYNENLNFLNKNGIKFYILIPPDKSVIYSEYMPDGAIYGIKSDKTRISQLLAINSDFIYPKNELLNNKGEELLYFKTDTHWTYYGAYFGYKALMDKIEHDFNIKGLKISEMRKESETYKTDLVNMVEIGGSHTERVPFYTCGDIKKSNLKIIVYGDSFNNFLMPYINCTFENPIFSKVNQFDIKTIKNIKPDIVVIEIVQRNLKHMFN